MERREVDVEVVVVSPIEDHRLKAVTPKNLIGQVRGPELCKERYKSGDICFLSVEALL